MIATIPSKAASKLMDLRHLADDLQTLANSCFSRASGLQRSCQNNPNSPEVRSWETEIERLRKYGSAHQEKYNGLAQLLAQIDHWGQTLRPQMVLADRPLPKFSLRDGENHIAAVDRIRTEIAELGLEVRRVSRADPTIDERKEAARRYVDGLVARNRPSLRITHNNFEFGLATEQSFQVKLNIPAALAWLDADKFLENLYAMIDEAPTTELVMTLDEKEKTIATLRQTALKKERIEEALISDAASTGLQIPRRPMANPAAVLSVTITTTNKETIAA